MSEQKHAESGTNATPSRSAADGRRSTKKAATKKTPAKAATAKKSPAKKTPAKKTATNKAPAKKTAKKAPAKKTVAKKAAPRKATSRSVSSPGERVSGAQRLHTYRTLDERVARGRAWRDAASLEGMEAFELSPKRPSALSILRTDDNGRVPELIPLRYGRMLTSAFAFYRGSASVMAFDLAQQPYTSGRTQLCGDAHLSNFGLFGSPERDLVFDVNDFDETLPGPFEWDLKRLAASVVLAARDRGFKKKEARRATIAACETYRQIIQGMAAMGSMDVWYAKVDAGLIEEQALRVVKKDDPSREKQARKRMTAILDKARSKTSARAAGKLTEIVKGERRFREDPPLLTREGITEAEIATLEKGFSDYKQTLNEDRRRLLERFKFIDVARKVVGVGSVGTLALVALFQGRDVDDPLVLQIKEAGESALEPYLGASEFAAHGQRVVEGQRYMQTASDIFLGWVKGPRRDFYVRQLHDMKGGIDLEKVIPEGLDIYARLCGGTLARAHARGGDVVAISSYIGDDDTFAQAIARFAAAYADQAESDYAAMQEAVASGALPVTTGI